MAIPNSQLEIWSHQGAMVGSRDTYAAIKKTLESSAAFYAGRGYTVFLQGSYGNDTNVRTESDVDVVIRLDDAFESDRSRLTTEDEQAFRAVHTKATYDLPQFKEDVFKTLQAAYPEHITTGDKAICISAGSNRRKADVLPCIAYKRYYRFKTTYDQSFDDGVAFYDSSGKLISNFPRQHCENMTSKHQSTSMSLKPMVRILKNLRNRLLAEDRLEAGVAPSYYLEGLLYNVPDSKYVGSHGEMFVNAIKWIQQEADKTKMVTANEQFYLLRDGFKTCWPIADAETFLSAAVNLWESWGDRALLV